MKIGGFLKFSLIDYPHKMAAVIFTQGCNFRCPYCQNSELVLPERFNLSLPEEEILSFLRKRQNQLEGVVITGGEPTIHDDLPELLEKIKNLQYAVKVDTNGTRPQVLQNLIKRKLIDYIAMDIKAPADKYDLAAGVSVDFKVITESVRLIIHSGLDHEFRTTLVKSLLKKDDLLRIKELITGAKAYTIQKFIPRDSVLDEKFRDPALDIYSEKEIEEFKEAIGFIN